MKTRSMAAYLWTLPITLIGLCFAPLALYGGTIRVVEGIVEMQGGLLKWLLSQRLLFVGNGAAMTLGHVILARNAACLTQSRAHERVHVRQFERWGIFLLPAYFLAGLVAKSRGLDAHLHNPFEQEAYQLSQGEF